MDRRRLVCVFAFGALVASASACGGPASSSPGPGSAEATDREVAATDSGDLREVADQAARAELARLEAERRQDDPAVRLGLEDYDATVLEQPAFVIVSYRYANPSPPFTPWEGHGMHFSIQVDRTTGATTLLRGR